MSVTQLISYFILIGSLPIMFQFVHTFLKHKKGEIWDIYKATTVLRGSALSTLWIVSVPSFSYAVQSTGASLSVAIFQGLLISLVGVGLAMVFLAIQEKKHGVDLSHGIQEEINRAIPKSYVNGMSNRVVIEFILLFISLLGSILGLHLISRWDLLTVIPLVVLGWTFIYFAIKRDLPQFFTEARYYLTLEIPLKTKEMSIFLSAGLLIYSLNVSGWGIMIVEGVYHFSEGIPWFNFLWVLPLIAVMLGFVGLGPLMSMVLIGGIIQRIHLPYSPEMILLSLTLGSAITSMLSPLVIPVIILSSANGRSPWKNGFINNWKYACVFYILVEGYLQLMLWWDIL